MFLDDFPLRPQCPAYSGAFLLTVDNLSFFAYSWSFFAYSGKVCLIRALRDCKQKSPTVSKKASPQKKNSVFGRFCSPPPMPSPTPSNRKFCFDCLLAVSEEGRHLREPRAYRAALLLQLRGRAAVFTGRPCHHHHQESKHKPLTQKASDVQQPTLGTPPALYRPRQPPDRENPDKYRKMNLVPLSPKEFPYSPNLKPFFAVIFGSVITELLPAPIFAVHFYLVSPRTDLCKKHPPVTKLPT